METKSSIIPENFASEVIIVSDIHIRDEHDDRHKLFCDLLDSLNANNSKTIVLNGDIFDFCFGPAQFYQKKFTHIGSRLSNLSKAGVEVIFVEGNHEFHIKNIAWDGVHYPKQDNFLIETSDAKKILLCHGDTIVEDVKYRLFRNFVKSRFTKFFVNLLPGSVIDALCLRYASHSRSQDQYRSLNHDRILGFAKNLVNKHAADYLVFGHFHFPYFHPAGTNRFVASVHSWDRPNALCYNQGELFRLSLSDDGVFVTEEVKHLPE